MFLKNPQLAQAIAEWKIYLERKEDGVKNKEK